MGVVEALLRAAAQGHGAAARARGDTKGNAGVVRSEVAKQEGRECDVTRMAARSDCAEMQRDQRRGVMQEREQEGEEGDGVCVARNVSTSFRTARSKLPFKRRVRRGAGGGGDSAAMAATRAVLRPAKRPRFVAPRAKGDVKGTDMAKTTEQVTEVKNIPTVANVDSKLVEMIMNEMLDESPNVSWHDIAGLEFAKRCVMEAVVWPMKRPDIFTGLRGPPKGLLLFGPPGTGKTMIGRAIASKSGAKFFNISASSLVSKWAGEGEKLVRALFSVARSFQPSVVFIDEIDSLLSSRSEGEQEHSRRLKTEFLVQMDGAGTSRDDRVLVVGATNRPQELDEAARRRLVKRLYIPLPDVEARKCLVRRLLERQTNSLTEEDVSQIGIMSKGYSGSDMYALCAEAALGPVRELGDRIGSVDVDHVRAVCRNDFVIGGRMVRASVSEDDLDGYRLWNDQFGSFPEGGAAK